MRERKYVDQIRFKRGRLKKLMDEIEPISKFLKWKRVTAGYVQFHLDNRVPDCLLWQTDQSKPQGIEITIAQGKARFYLMRELAQLGTGRAFLELQDNETSEKFEQALVREADGYTTDQALASVKSAVQLCLKAKNHPKYAGMDLLIHGPVNVATLPRQHWNLLRGDLIEAAKTMPFRETT